MTSNERLANLSTEKLTDIVKNYRQYGYDEKVRLAAISVLEERGVTKEQLELSGNFINAKYEFAEQIYRSFCKNSGITFIFYGIVFLSNILILIYRNSCGPENIYMALWKFLICVPYLFFLIKSFLDQSQFYKEAGDGYGADGALLYLCIGMPLYIFMYFYFRNQMKEKMKEIK